MASVPPRTPSQPARSAIASRSRAKPVVEDGRGHEQRERDQAAGEVVGRRRFRIGLQEAVVDDVQGDRTDRKPRHSHLLRTTEAILGHTSVRE